MIPITNDLNAAVEAIALALFSVSAFAERGSSEANQLAYPESMSQHQSDSLQYIALSDLSVINR
jgi:hypothetical protein